MKSKPLQTSAKSIVMLIAVLAAITAAECFAATRWLFQHEFLSMVGVHLVVCSLAGFFAYYAFKKRMSALAVLAAPLIFAGGPFGSGLCLFAAIIYAVFWNSKTKPLAWLETFFDYRKDNNIEYVRNRIAFGQDDVTTSNNVEPFSDILSGGSILQKQLALAKIARYFRPNLAPLLLQAVRDSDAAVRVQAATAMARIERDFMKRRMQMEKKLKGTPQDSEGWLELAELYDEYAYAGLADREECDVMREKAVEIYRSRRGDPGARLKLARLYLRNNEPQKVYELLEPSIENGAPPEAIGWYMEALFRLKRFKDLRKFARRHAGVMENADCFNMMPEMESAVSFWNVRPSDGNRKRSARAHA